MKFRKYRDLNLPSEDGYEFLLLLQKYLNQELYELFQDLKKTSRYELSKGLITKAEELIDCINKYGYKLYLADYGGDKNYENSDLLYSNKSLNIQFRGYSAQVNWEKW